MPSLTLGCSCVGRLTSLATGRAVECWVENGQLIVHLPRIPAHVFGLHVSVKIGLESAGESGSDELVLRYHVYRVAGLPGFLVGWLVDWVAAHLVRHPLIHVKHGKVHINLGQVRVGPQALTAVVRVRDLRLPAGPDACFLSFVPKE